MWGLTYVVAAILLFVYSANGLPRIDPLVDSNVGLIRGLTASDGAYSMFLGIPYATVNASNPFGPSIPHERFVETFNAYDDSAECPQREEFNNTLTGTLDCLHLNVYVPHSATSRNRLPVLVWIHGGGFNKRFGGRFSRGPKFLVRHNVIVVDLNYRLGAYGWMCLNTPEVPGNQGLKDQLTALRWVKNNIEAFGGDSDKITIVGESAGGISVDLHMIFSQENLFNNVIIQSGTSVHHDIIAKPDPSAPLRLAGQLGHPTNDLSDALDFLRQVDTNLVVAATSEIGLRTLPCVEQEFENVERYITDHPSVASIPNPRTKSVLIGFNSNESGNNYDFTDPELAFWDPFAALDSLDYDLIHLAEMKNTVRNFYIGEESFNEKVQQQVNDFNSDYYCLHPTYRCIRKYFDYEIGSVYHYMFSYDGGRNFLKRKNNYTVPGAVHADELSYMFDVALFPETPSMEDQLIIDRLTTLWTNFVKYSNPTPEISDLLPIQWPAITKDATNCFIIDSELSVQRKPFNERMAFWDLFYKLNDAYSAANVGAIPYNS